MKKLILVISVAAIFLLTGCKTNYFWYRQHQNRKLQHEIQYEHSRPAKDDSFRRVRNWDQRPKRKTMWRIMP